MMTPDQAEAAVQRDLKRNVTPVPPGGPLPWSQPQSNEALCPRLGGVPGGQADSLKAVFHPKRKGGR